MLFNSYEFLLLYLPVVAFGFFFIGRKSPRVATLWLALASLFFYGWWNPKFTWILLVSIGFNYVFGGSISRWREVDIRGAKYILIFAVIFNLCLLGYFKYINFFIDVLNDVVGTEYSTLSVILPLGISFFTFTQIAFLVDAYRGQAKEYDLVHYLLFVTYFPHLIAGPVLHHKQMMPQFANRMTYRFDIRNINIGLTILAIGLFKKVVFADQFSSYADSVFNDASVGNEPQLVETWFGVTAYALQLYFDFSAYSDMAIGLSKIFNIDIPINFNSPYKATNIIDFWRRWHMTLSAFLRDYLYIPLGGNRYGKFRRYINLMVTMVLGGFWHGASWNFVIWGALHGGYLIINHGWRVLSGRHLHLQIKPMKIIYVGLTFVAVLIAWVFFRAEDINAAMRILHGMFGFHGLGLPVYLYNVEWVNTCCSFVMGDKALVHIALSDLLWVLLGLIIVWFLPNCQEISQYIAKKKSHSYVVGFAVGGTLVFVMMSFKKVSPFIYFQF